MAQWPMLKNKKQYPWAEVVAYYAISQLSPFNKDRQVLLQKKQRKKKKGKEVSRSVAFNLSIQTPA
jgi:hypothetical protein